MLKQIYKLSIVIAILLSSAPIGVVFAEHDTCEYTGGSLSPYEACLRERDDHTDSNEDDNQSLNSATGGLNTSDSSDIENNPIVVRLKSIARFLLSGVAIVTTISVVIAGLQYITSNGDPQKTAKAVQRLTYAGVAIFLWIFGLAILQWILPGGVIEL